MKTAKRGEARGTASRDLEGRRAQQARREKKSLQEACRRRGKAQLDQLGSSMATSGRKEERQEKRSDSRGVRPRREKKQKRVEEKERKIRDDKDTQGLQLWHLFQVDRHKKRERSRTNPKGG